MTVRELINELERLSDSVPNGGDIEVTIAIPGKTVEHFRCIDKVDCVADSDLEPVITIYPE